MFIKNIKIKFISILFLIFLIFYTLSVNLTFAVSLASPITPNGVPAYDQGVQWNTYVIANTMSGTPGFLDKDANPTSINNIAKLAMKRLLRDLTDDIVDWINSGFEGNPAFITNTKQFLVNTADVTIGDFLMNSEDLSFLCEPFKINIKLSLGLQYRPFSEEIQCSFTSALGNAETAMNDFLNGDFIGGGGWDSWLQITTIPQNNQMGAMMLAQAELDARIQTNKDNAIKEVDWGGGFMSWKDCPDETYSPDADGLAAATADESRIERYATLTAQERGDDGCVIKTPGGVIANKINWIDTSTIRELELADDLNAIVNALANTIADNMFDYAKSSISGSGLLGGVDASSNNDAYNEYMEYLSELEARQATSTGSVE